MQLHWHRRDLRGADNRALAAAAEAAREADSSVVSLFVFDDEVLDHAGAPRVDYLLDAVAELRAWYRDRGGDLLVRHGDPREAVPAVAEAVEADRVVWNTDYSGLARQRDAAVRQALAAADIRRESFHDAICHEPGSITTNAGDPYSVFTYFGRKWQDRGKDDPYPAPEPEQLVEADAVGVDAGSLPTLADLGFDQPEAELLAAGTAAARKRLAAFCEDGIYRYEEDRDYPMRKSTSRLSADLKYGTIGIREVYWATEEAREEASEAQLASIEEFQSQLAWRAFYTHVLWFNPEVVSKNYKEYNTEIEWENDAELLEAWKDGKTGYPIVDAGMRQLRAEGFMHNRVRMIVASFLTKDLLIDWREGYDWFRQKLVDHDTANDNGGWQWAASTGTDAQPYFRIFNPMTQGERYDPDAEYIKTYVAELRDTDPEIIHTWHEASLTQRRNAAPDYPDPIVDHSDRREKAIAMFEAARGE
ncbi:cryptochrome/photolyase family protein [Halohasta litorea]|uniref:Cryptochrome/photolyase family protein n=1 Tax=Halohasta litorea TaxID=869891 RepID=A0ABD6D8I2_9EURY|nr:deoxyribodipyrimidine photo-lyase [Halohasta litorea]